MSDDDDKKHPAIRHIPWDFIGKVPPNPMVHAAIELHANYPIQQPVPPTEVESLKALAAKVRALTNLLWQLDTPHRDWHNAVNYCVFCGGFLHSEAKHTKDCPLAKELGITKFGYWSKDGGWTNCESEPNQAK